MKRPWYKRSLPGWFQFGGGGGGGSFTGVFTDTTLTGNGLVATPLGLKQAFTDASLQGDGTVASPLSILKVSTTAELTGAGTTGSPLSVAGWPLTWFTTGLPVSALSLGAANVVSVYGFALPYTLTFANVGIYVAVADAVNNYDLGLYTKAGNLIANIGPQTLPNAAQTSIATLQGSQTIAPGLYLFAWTGDVGIAQIYGYTYDFSWVVNGNIAASAAGTLPPAIGAVAVASAFDAPFLFLS